MNHITALYITSSIISVHSEEGKFIERKLAGITRASCMRITQLSYHSTCITRVLIGSELKSLNPTPVTSISRY